MPHSYRIRTNIGVDKQVNLTFDQDFDFIEILSLKLTQTEIYQRRCSDYGVIAGRISVNGGFGLPNAKLSVFIPLTNEDAENPIISELYPFKAPTDKNEDGYKYNLLPKSPQYVGHVPTGTFFDRDEVLLEKSIIEVYDKYYKYTVSTNESGDFMIFGVPTGQQTLVMNLDLSDIGCFSLSPQDLIDAGLAVESQVNGSQFKASSNLNELPQILTLYKQVNVEPLWGDPDICFIGITRTDFDLSSEVNLTIKPTGVFMGSIATTQDEDALKSNCRVPFKAGNFCSLKAGQGRISAIRQTINVDDNGNPILEEYFFEQGGKVIDGDGTFLVKLPMNLDYVTTDEFGNQILSIDPTVGIPTKGKYRFKISWQNDGGIENEILRANFLVPNIREYGWAITTPDADPTLNLPSDFSVSVPGTSTSSSPPLVLPAQTGGLILQNFTNSQDVSITINGVPYTGSLTSIPITSPGTNIVVNCTAVDTSQNQIFEFSFYDQASYDAYRSYAFSLDWDDYGDSAMIQEAIDCDDRFYEFNYNKVYTTAMFLDRYKNGILRSRHLGIKEIDDRECISKNNPFPVNDAVQKFDFIYFLAMLLLNILTFPILILLFVAHFVAWAWPVIKWVLIILCIYFLYIQVRETIDAINSAIESAATAIPGGPVINIGAVLRAAWQILQALFKLALYILFFAFVIVYIVRLKGFRRIGLPMLAYPECNACSCDCGEAPIDDDFDIASVTQQLNDGYNQQQADAGSPAQTSTDNTFLASVNQPQFYSLAEHPNYPQISDDINIDENDGGRFYCSGSDRYRSLLNRVFNEEITSDVLERALLDFQRIFSGYDVIESSEKYKLHAPQPFLFAAELTGGGDERWFAYPTRESYPQKLNDFNTRDKYFYDSVGSVPGTGVNKIRTVLNPSLTLTPSDPIEDQVIVLLAKAGTTLQLGKGELVTFQDPNSSSGLVNITGATENQFNNNAITGVTAFGNITTPISRTVDYADPSSNGSVGITANVYLLNTGDTDNYLQYPTDIEYFQVITGMTYSSFYNLANTTNVGYYPLTYLLHEIEYVYEDQCFPYVNTNPLFQNLGPAIDNVEASNRNSLEVIILTRGVDPFTPKQEIEYDLSYIFGETSYGTGPIVTGEYYFNYPIQPLLTNNIKPLSHDTLDNTTTNLYFPSLTFNITPGQYTAFTSTLPYYYLSTDDNSGSYTPSTSPAFIPVSSQSSAPYNFFTNPPFNQVIPKYVQDYFVGGTFIGAETTDGPSANPLIYDFLDSVSSNNEYGDAPSGYNSLYSRAYYRYLATTVNFSDETKLVMRSDRLPTSTRTEDGVGSETGYGLHQNNNFYYFKPDGAGSTPTLSAPGTPPTGNYADSSGLVTGLTSTLTCEGLTPLKCYTGSGTNFGVSTTCEVPDDRVVNGCYCLLNKKYITEYTEDVLLFLEWKVRYLLMLAACRGVFARVFQNNWINGFLYMPSFNKTSTYAADSVTDPTYNYCRDTIVFDDTQNSFYYRSSPYDRFINQFIGKPSPTPPNNLASLIVSNPGYNEKQLQAPTTIVDLGPRDGFINQVCGNENLEGYFVNQMKSTSYNDDSDILQMGIISRLINQTIVQQMLPIATNSNEGEGIGVIQFFNSNRGGDRIDGDFAQAFSANSEFKVKPYLNENYPNNYLFVGDDLQSPSRPIFGVFYQSDSEQTVTRKRYSPGVQTYNLNPFIGYNFGYPTTQEVPFYKWQITTPSDNIFGTENNNWYTDILTTNNGFYKSRYQDLDPQTSDYFKTTTTQDWHITNFTPSPDPSITNVVYGAPNTPGQDPIVMGAPFHFYFGLNNGFTALDRFIKLYVNNSQTNG
jgi:hypothetical protein